MNTIPALIVAVEQPIHGFSTARLLRVVPKDCGQNVPDRSVGTWVDIHLSQEMVAKAKEVGSPVAIVNLDSANLEVVDVHNSRDFSKELASLPPSGD